jgi:hypothetical protein
MSYQPYQRLAKTAKEATDEAKTMLRSTGLNLNGLNPTDTSPPEASDPIDQQLGFFADITERGITCQRAVCAVLTNQTNRFYPIETRLSAVEDKLHELQRTSVSHLQKQGLKQLTKDIQTKRNRRRA